MMSPTNHEHVLVTCFGADRPGIVEDLTRWVLDSGGNVEESRMARLGSEFAALVLVSGAPCLTEKLSATREAFERETSLNVVLKPVAAGFVAGAAPSLRYRLEATALDHPGIVNRIAQVLRAHGASIAEAATHIEQAPFTSTPVFRVSMEVDIPASTSVAKLRSDLAQAAEADGIDVLLLPR
ncbi:MAG: glycine cleavage system protein R [Candidatus Sumerlaeaceae bacterium]|jgi:glycine cleavage system transcriptional repressor